MILVKLTKEDYTGTEDFFNRAVNFIHSNEKEFNLTFNSKLHGVKMLKEETNGCLKDCKNICVLYWAEKILNKKEKRVQKLKNIENAI